MVHIALQKKVRRDYEKEKPTFFFEIRPPITIS